MNNPEYVIANEKKYKIDTSFKTAIKCSEIANDSEIGDFERSMAVILLLFGEEALDDTNNHQRLLELAKKYLSCGKEVKEVKDSEIDMDLTQDYDYIKASFMSDYQIDLEEKNMHWWTFMNLMNGLSNSEIGSCCILNRIRNLRTTDTSKIKDAKQREQIRDAQQRVALKKNEKPITVEQKEGVENFYKQTGIKRKE